MTEPIPPLDAEARDDLLAGLAEDFVRRDRAGERPSVDEYCAKHPDLADRIRDLFDAVIALEHPGPGVIVGTAPPTERVGSTVGRYKLLERIGEGGFGVVYMAEQQHPVRRKVALKVIKPGCDTKQVIARFEAERQALALMDHENIARVLDVGATDSGLPYFVMELVHGMPITDYCDRNQLPPRQRLELFAQVCWAVQHAHTKGIIHRDLKPTNVLVTLHEGASVPKVIDFGVAKATGQQLTEKTLFTNLAQMLGTPLYMSPEQAEMTGTDVDARTDVYSLGVLLYELLTGTTPVDKDRLRQAAFDEVRRIIREEEPPRPSTRLSAMGEPARLSISAQRGSDPRQLRQLFHRELDWIVMKALEKDRNRRYETASALAVDVRHFLEDEPVSARPSSALYRMRKLAVKYKVGFGAAAAVAAALVLGVAGTSLMAYRATKARDRAVTLSGELDRQRRDALDAKTRAERAQAQAENDRTAMKASEEEARSALGVLDKMFTAADPERHEPDVTVRQMIERAVAQVDRQQPAYPARVEGAIRHVLGTAYQGLGRFPEAEAQFRKALALRQAALPANHPTVAQNLSRLGTLLAQQRRFDEALPPLEQALRIYRGANITDQDVFDTLVWLQHANFAMGRIAESEQYGRDNAELRAKVADDDTDLRIANAVFESYSRAGRADYVPSACCARRSTCTERHIRGMSTGS